MSSLSADKLVAVAGALRLLAASGFAALALAALWASVPTDGASPPEAPPRSASIALEPAPPSSAPLEASATSEAPARPVPTSPAELPPLRPRQILIDLGPPRSEVFVDGHRVGHTPFLGQVRCRPGREIAVQVIPERGLPLAETRVCPP